MDTRITEIAEGLFRFSTLVEAVAPPAGFTFNQFLLLADEPLLFHCGHRSMFDSLLGAVGKVMPVEKLRWISFSHLEADECGAMNLWLQAAPRAEVAHGRLGCDVSLQDLADRAPRALEDGEVIDLGGKLVRFLATPHLPHGWDAGMLYEESGGTLLCSDLLGQVGDGPAITEGDLVGPALKAEEMFRSMSVTGDTLALLRRLAALAPRRLAIMHGSSFTGDCRSALETFAEGLAERAILVAEPL